MVYFRSYWPHLDISMTICPHQIAAVGFKLMNLGFLRLGPLLTAPSVRTMWFMRYRLIYEYSYDQQPKFNLSGSSKVNGYSAK